MIQPLRRRHRLIVPALLLLLALAAGLARSHPVPSSRIAAWPLSIPVDRGSSSTR